MSEFEDDTILLLTVQDDDNDDDDDDDDDVWLRIDPTDNDDALEILDIEYPAANSRIARSTTGITSSLGRRRVCDGLYCSYALTENRFISCGSQSIVIGAPARTDGWSP